MEKSKELQSLADVRAEYVRQIEFLQFADGWLENDGMWEEKKPTENEKICDVMRSVT